jgi:hypothetical protein
VIFGSAQVLIFFALAIGAFLAEAWALIDSLKYTNGAYFAAGKRNKATWTAILGAAATIGFLGLPWPLGVPFTGPLDLPGLAAIVFTIVYFVSVRPAVMQHQPRRPHRGRDDNRGGW